MHVNRVLYWLSVLLEAFPEGVVDAGNNSIYARRLHRRSCVLGVFGYIFETAVLAEFVHITELNKIHESFIEDIFGSSLVL